MINRVAIIIVAVASTTLACARHEPGSTAGTTSNSSLQPGTAGASGAIGVSGPVGVSGQTAADGTNNVATTSNATAAKVTTTGVVAATGTMPVPSATRGH
jgi:hypothetical protein